MWTLVLTTLLGAGLSAFLYPLVLWLVRLVKARDALEKIFRSSEHIRLVPSYVRLGGKRSVRDSDHRVASGIGALTQAEHSDDSVPFSFTYPAFPLVIIGSTRYNRLAQALQEQHCLPFEFVIARHDDDPSASQLTILTQFGEELVSSADTLSLAEGVEVDYAILLLVRLADGRTLYWIAGIHSAGTEGAWHYLRDKSLKVYQEMPTRRGELTASLIRVQYTLEDTTGDPLPQLVEALGPPVRGSLHRRADKEVPVALLCDLGNVLMDFDRTRTYRAIAHHVALSWREVRKRIEGCDIRQRYECGAIETEEFCDEIYSILEVDASALERPLLKEFWGDIFWLNREMACALRYLHGKGVFLLALSNTNPLHFASIARDYPDVVGLFSSRVLSYEVGYAKPDTRIFELAIDTVRREVEGCATKQMLVIDDSAEHIDAASTFGMRALQYRSYTHFVFWARRQGLYIP